MPLTYQAFVETRKKNPEEFSQKILPQMDLLEAVLRETVRTLNNARPKDTARIKEFNAMADAIHTVCHPGALSRESTKIAAMQRFGTLRDFLEKEDGKNYQLLEATVKEHPELLANLPQAEQRKPMMERYRDLSVYFGLNYSEVYTRRFNKVHRERFLANRDKDPVGFRNYTAKQIDYVSGVFRQLAQELEQERGGTSRESRELRRMAEYLTVLKTDEASPQEMENALEKLRGLSDLLEENAGQLGLALHSAAAKDPKLLELLPASPALRKMPVLQHLTEIFPVLSLDLTKGLQQLAAQENLLVTEEQEQLAQQQEEAARLADLQAEEEDAKEELHYQHLEETLRKNTADREKQEQDRRAAFLQAQTNHRNQNGPFALPPQYNDLDAAGMVLHSAKENGPQYQALVNFSQKLDAAIKQWDSCLEPGGVLEQRLAAEMAQLPEQAPEEVQTSAIEAALEAVSPEAQEKFLLERLAGEYENRLAAEQARLGPNATPEQARASLYREELTESFREPLREAAYSPQQLEKNREDAALALAAEKRDAMDAGARQAYDKDKAQLRNDVIARRIRNKLLEAGQDEDFRQAFLNDQMPTTQDREQYYLAHNREADLVNNYHMGVERQEVALYNSRLNELLNQALYDRTKWKELNQLFEKLGVPANIDGANPKALLDHLLNAARDETLEAETERTALEKLSKTLPDWEIARRARHSLPLEKNDQALLYGWAREQKKAQVRRAVRRERRQAMPELAALGIDKAKAMRRDLKRILDGCNGLLPTEAENKPLAFDYEQAVLEDEKLSDRHRQQLIAAYKRYQAEQQNGGQPQAPQAPDPRMSEADKRAQRAKLREERHWRRILRIDMIERRQAAETRRRQAIDEVKNQKIRDQYPVVGAAVARVRANLQGINPTQGELGEAFKGLDKAWTQGDLQSGQALKEKLDFRPRSVETQKQLIEADDRLYPREDDKEPQDDLAGGQGLEQDDENNVQRNYTQVDDDFLFRVEDQNPLQQEPQVQKPKYYVFQPEFVDEEQMQQEALRQNLAQGLNQGPQPVNQPSGKRVVIQGKSLHGKLRDTVEEISANPALKGAAVDVIMPDQVPGPASDHVEEQILPPQNTARSEMHSASWWIKKLRSPENLYKRNPETRTKELDITKLACIMAARDLANSVRGEKANLVNKNLSPGQIRARAAELANQPDFNNFILKIRSDPELQRKAISAVGEGHGGGLDDLFSEYLARKAPGELPVSPELKRWAPSALQRIEGLQEQLRQGNLDEFQAKKRVAEIIAARKLVGARRAGFLQHADQRLNQKLTDPAKLNAKAGDLETCLNMLTSDQIQDLARQAKEGHGGAMLESFKKLNTVKLHMDEIKRGLAFNPKYKVDAALAMAIYKENAQNPDAQLDDTRAMRTAAALRGLPFYKEFEQREETADKLKQNVDIGGLYNDYVQFKDEHKPEKQNPEEHPLNELLEEEGPQRTSTQESALNWQ